MRRRRRHDRLKRVRTIRREDATFFARGTIPASARSVAICTCGARAFSRVDDYRFHEDFDDSHRYCAEELAS